MTNPNELYQKEMVELMDEINIKTKSWFEKLKEQSKNTRVEMWSLKWLKTTFEQWLNPHHSLKLHGN